MRRPPVGVALAWLTVIFSVPFVGAGVYLLFGEKRLGPWRAESLASNLPAFQDWQRRCKLAHPTDMSGINQYAKPLINHAENVLGFPALPDNEIELLAGYNTFFDKLIADIEGATKSVHLDFYIWFNGGRMDDLIAALINASSRGVECLGLADALGSSDFLQSKSVDLLADSGVKLVTELPTGGLRTLVARADLRNHRKIVVIDDVISYTGSQNLLDPKFFKKSYGVGEWVDAMVRITGPASSSLDGVFRLDWATETDTQFVAPEIMESVAETEERESSVYGALMQIVPSGPDLQPEAIHQILLLAIYSAQRELIMTTPYFVPGEAIMTALISASLRGVKVTIVVPAHNDSVLVRYAGAAHYDDLLAAGITVANFNGGLLHTKSLTIDGEISVFGSVNLDMRSLWLNFEISLVVYDQDFTSRLRGLQCGYLEDSELLDLAVWQQRPALQQFAENLLRLASPLL